MVKSSSRIVPNWIFPPPQEVPAELRAGLNGSEFLLESLVRRGVRTPGAAAAFLDFHTYSPTRPEALPGVLEAVDRIQAAIKNNEGIGVWGDFDVDGQTATAVLVDTLSKIGAEVTFHIPVRGQESHGISLMALQRFIQPTMKVIVTCDTGISAHEAADYLRSIKVDLIITDHHQLPSELPDSYAIIDPQFMPEDHPLHDLPGVGVAYKLAEALLDANNLADSASELHDLVALGTIADLAILRADTRYLVQSGLERIRSSPRLFLIKMAEMLELPLDRLNEEHIGFYIAPRLNAVGRLDDANPMVDFLLSNDPIEVKTILNQMEALNASRRVLVSQVFQGCLAQLESNPALLDLSVLILSHPEWPAGVIGIAAGRLAELIHRPVILFSGGPEGTLRGSSRSIAGIDITFALTQNKDLLLSYGGHPMAAGLSLEAASLPEFRARMQKTVAALALEHHVEPELQIETAMNLSQVNFDLLADLDCLAPFGPGNPSPVFVAPGLTLEDASTIGHSAEHRQVIVEDAQGEEFKVLWWQGADLPLPEGRFDLAYTPHMNVYKGTPSVQYDWIDARPSHEAVPVARRKTDKKLELLDFRQYSEITPEISAAASFEKALIWREGINSYPPSTYRDHLVKSSILVIHTIPPSSKVLMSALEKVKPASIFFLGELPAENELAFFLKQLGSIIKQTMQASDSTHYLTEMAARFATTTEMVRLGLEWFSARGLMTIEWDADGRFLLTSGGQPDPQGASGLQPNLKRHADEISAFRRYYLKASLESLVDFHGK